MCLRSIFSKRQSSGVFKPTTQGFKEYNGDVGNGSFNDVAKSLGYHQDQVQSYHGRINTKSAIYCVAFEVFSDNIAFVLTKPYCKRLTRRRINRFLKHFSLEETFDSYTVEYTLDRGIENRSLSADFLTKVLLIRNSDDNGIHHVDSIGHYLIFSGGYLIDYRPSDGLNKWAKNWKERFPAVLERYVAHAKLHWGNRLDMIERIVNAQADAFANTPDGANNEFIYLHRTPSRITDFVMLLVCHYQKPMSITEFKDLNFGCFEEMPSEHEGELTYYKLGNFTYTFLADGQLVKFELEYI